MRNQNDGPEGEEVIFKPALNVDEELIVTQAKEAEEDIKATVDRLADIEGIERRYNKGEPLSEDERLLLKMKTLDQAPHEQNAKIKSDGSTASYYELPEGATQLQDLISHRNMNAQLGEIFRECYRYGQASHCDELRGAKKIKFYIDAEITRLEKLAEKK